MSRTIITKSDSEFFTNVNSEQLLGELCCHVGAKHYHNNSGPRLAYSMTRSEADDTVAKLKTLIGKEDKLIKKYKHYFEKGSTGADFKETLDYYIKCFEDSHGYECI